MRTPEIFLVRHGETVWNVEGRFQGALDSPLTVTGIAQVEAIGRRLAELLADAPPVAMRVSPLGRTRQTAALLGGFHTYSETSFDPRLREVTLGEWEGLTLEEMDAGWPTRFDGTTQGDWYFSAPGGETYDAAAARAGEWLAEREGSMVAVSHGLFSRLIRGAYLGLPRKEALSLPVPQDVIWHLRDGTIEAITATPRETPGTSAASTPA
jgi:probable phosphoglycerate mutase